MFKTIIVLIIVFVVALAGILTWHTVETNRIKSRMAEIEKEVASHKKVMIDIAVAAKHNGLALGQAHVLAGIHAASKYQFRHDPRILRPSAYTRACAVWDYP
jgi:hypothetical protein